MKEKVMIDELHHNGLLSAFKNLYAVRKSVVIF